MLVLTCSQCSIFNSFISFLQLELRNFEEYFREQWALKKKEFNKSRAALYMTHQHSNATIFTPTAMPINTTNTTNTSATANASMVQGLSPHNRYNAGVKDVTLLSNAGFSPISSRMSSYTPFLPIRTAQDSPSAINSSASSKSNAPYSPTRNTAQNHNNHNNYHGMLNQVLSAMQPSAKNGSILRPGSTLSAKHALSSALQNTYCESNSSSKYSTSPRRAQVSNSADPTALRDLLANSRSKKFNNKSSKESESTDIDPAKLDAIHLVNVLFGRKYHKRILKDKHKLESTSYDDEDSDLEEPVRTYNSTNTTTNNANLAPSVSYSNSSSDISDSDLDMNSQQSSEEEEEEESLSDSDSLSDTDLQTVFRFIPGAKHNDMLLPSAMVAHKESKKKSTKSSSKSSIQRTGDRSMVNITKPPTLSRTTGTVNFAHTISKNQPSIVNHTGKAPRQSFFLSGEGSRKSRKSVAQNPDQVILQRYHTEEKQRIEKEARCADVVRSWQEIQHKLAAEKALAEKNPFSIHFVPRTACVSYHSPMKSPMNSHMNSPIIGSPVRSPVMGHSAAKGAMGVLRARKRFLEVGKTGKDHKTAQGSGHGGISDAENALEEENQRYHALMEPARDDYVQHYSRTKMEPHNATLIQDPYGAVPTTVDKELYFAVDKATHRDRDSSPTKSKTHSSAPTESLSPSKMYAERNKTPPALPPATIRVKTRNDEEFNARAYKLAEKIDLTYLVSSFNPANHSKEKTIVLDEDLALLKATALSESTLNTSATPAATEPIVELTPAEKRQRAQEYAEYMKKLYEDEMALMMENLVSQLPDKLGSKVRKALAAQKLRQKMKERLKYIKRRRKVESLGSDQVEKLSKFYEMQGEYVMTDSSSDDEAAKAKASREMNNLLGEFATMDEAQMKALLEARAAEEQAIRDAEEAKRLRRYMC